MCELARRSRQIRGSANAANAEIGDPGGKPRGEHPVASILRIGERRPSPSPY
ncbi:hypothetical protein QEH59_18105 [Coraliomargarita sp. SDUM461004]|uniref:Uncharacterized protein n=1 Tax=Thalassobacterium sedimentorum TaxID=3041258 RepID=A0ABU1ANM5_9BACT|nr:hypothetical protein [Coraliomargarita sp. SDUM461004]MDQ8196349.1 hypothetical protein [Coraliomargarita sp. SDUM461004]